MMLQMRKYMTLYLFLHIYNETIYIEMSLICTVYKTGKLGCIQKDFTQMPIALNSDPRKNLFHCKDLKEIIVKHQLVHFLVRREYRVMT